MRVLGLVPARGGSKGVPRKNIRLLGGKPLIQWTADTARDAKRLTRTVCSTDDDEIATVARAAGLDVPFIRPAELAQDTTPTLPVVQHAIRTLEAAGERYDAVCLLQATSPLRTARDIDLCIELLENLHADAVVTVARVPAEHNPHWVYFVDESTGALRISTGETEPIPRRQDLPPAFHRDGSIFVTRCDVVLAGSLYGARVIGHQSKSAHKLDIDSPEDWERAEQILRESSSAS